MAKANVNLNLSTEEKWEWFDKVFDDLVHNQVKKLHNKPLYYEVWIDWQETYIKRWFEYAYQYPYLASYNIARWLIKRDSWYWGDSYMKELNKATSEGKDALSALEEVLHKSL